MSLTVREKVRKSEKPVAKPKPPPLMHFNHLPIQFDAVGHTFLYDGDWPRPFYPKPDGRGEQAYHRALAVQRLTARPAIREFDLPLVTQVSSGLSLHSVIDFEQRKVWDARVGVTLLRELETVLLQRHPSDASHLAARACGRDSAAHALAATLAVEMVCGVSPPPLAILARNLGQCAELIANGLQNLFMLAGPDYAEAVVSRVNPEIWRKAQVAAAPRAELHGLPTIAEIMRGLNPPRGDLFSAAWQMLRVAREIAAMLFGKYPHPTTLFPGGVGSEADKEFFTQILGRVNQLIDFAKRVVALWNDLVDFFYEAEPRYQQVGATPANFLSLGLWDDPEAYAASYATCNEWGGQRLAPPGVIINGLLRTTRLTGINLGLEEFVEHAYYESWLTYPDGCRRVDPLESPLSPFHPWNKQTWPQPQPQDWLGKYSWATAPRWDREVVETGPLARLWITTRAGQVNHEFIGLHQTGLEFELPKFQTPACRVAWQLPERPNALERMRARAVEVAYAATVAYGSLLRAFEYLRRGELALAEPYRVPDEGLGVGFCEGARGVALHHLVIDEGRLRNYQISTALNWLAAPRDRFGAPGVLETALLNTPLLEDYADPDAFSGIDLLRTIRSFDP